MLLLVPAAVGQSSLELAVLQETNAVRQRYGLEPLAWDDRAAVAARGHALDMLERNYFAHDTPEGTTVAERMWRAGVTEVKVGENIAFYEGYTPEEAIAKVVTDWMNSPHHRENILRPEFTHLGVGLAIAGDRVMVVQDFLSRPFAVEVWKTPSRGPVGILSFSGSSPATVGVFVNGVYVEALQPPSWRGRLELLPDSRVDLGLWQGSSYYLECSFTPPELNCPSRKIDWRASYERRLTDTVRLQVGLPTGNYLLARGLDTPVPFMRVSGQVYVEVPREWGAVWIGIESEGRVEYTHRIGLK